MDAENIEVQCSLVSLSVTGMRKDKWFLPGGFLGAVSTRLSYSPSFAQLVLAPCSRRCLEAGGGDAK